MYLGHQSTDQFYHVIIVKDLTDFNWQLDRNRIYIFDSEQICHFLCIGAYLKRTEHLRYHKRDVLRS